MTNAVEIQESFTEEISREKTSNHSNITIKEEEEEEDEEEISHETTSNHSDITIKEEEEEEEEEVTKAEILSEYEEEEPWQEEMVEVVELDHSFWSEQDTLQEENFSEFEEHDENEISDSGIYSNASQLGPLLKHIKSEILSDEEHVFPGPASPSELQIKDEFNDDDLLKLYSHEDFISEVEAIFPETVVKEEVFNEAEFFTAEDADSPPAGVIQPPEVVQPVQPSNNVSNGENNTTQATYCDVHSEAESMRCFCSFCGVKFMCGQCYQAHLLAEHVKQLQQTKSPKRDNHVPSEMTAVTTEPEMDATFVESEAPEAVPEVIIKREPGVVVKTEPVTEVDPTVFKTEPDPLDTMTMTVGLCTDGTEPSDDDILCAIKSPLGWYHCSHDRCHFPSNDLGAMIAHNRDSHDTTAFIIESTSFSCRWPKCKFTTDFQPAFDDHMLQYHKLKSWKRSISRTLPKRNLKRNGSSSV